jgi:hypothetical protein
MKKFSLIITVSAAMLLIFTSCKTVDQISEEKDIFQKENEEFLALDSSKDFVKKIPGVNETFRVLLSSERYTVAQGRYLNYIERNPDAAGDKYISSEMSKYDMINEARTGIISVWLYPDSGRIMKIRSQRPTYFKEIDALINDDIMRWNFTFPRKVIEPTRFDIVYRVVLRKKKSDDEIIKAVQQKIMEEN